MQYDVFICHASEDKEDFVRPLAERLRLQHLQVWYDEFSLSIGDSLTEKIDEGLKKSRFGIVVLSPSFFKKPWAKRELKGLTAREMAEKADLILPIWHRVTLSEVLEFSPPLADKKAASSGDGINVVLREITKKLRPDESPLIVARDHLVNLGLEPPPISDEWWLDMVEFKEYLRFPDLNYNRRWIFPLPCPNEDRGLDRGLNIASAALQSDWSFDGEELGISPITPPDQVHEFIRQWPGLFDCARQNAAVLALYAPQITIPGFDEGFEDVFDQLMEPGNKGADRIFSYGHHDTVDDMGPLCGDVIAYRHPLFGNYTEDDLGHWYFDAHDTYYFRCKMDIWEGLVWLLSADSDWLPDRYRDVFIRGILSRDQWTHESDYYNNIFFRSLLLKTKSKFKLTKTVKAGLIQAIDKVKEHYEIKDDSHKIMQKLIEWNAVGRHYDYREWLESQRAKK
jgi:transcriptional regulator with XRE-family HTH domain